MCERKTIVIDHKRYKFFGERRYLHSDPSAGHVRRFQALGISWEKGATRDGKTFTITEYNDGEIMAIEIRPLCWDLCRYPNSTEKCDRCEAPFKQ